MFKINITGDKEIDNVLNKLEPKQIKSVIISAARQSAKTTLEVAKANFPKLSGRAAASLKIKAGSRRAEKRGVFGVRIWTGPRDELGIDTNDRYYYPSAVEFGTERMAARRPLRRATDSTRTKVQESFAVQVRNAIHRLAERYAKKGKKLGGIG